eukprot:Pgem_evm1s16919
MPGFTLKQKGNKIAVSEPNYQLIQAQPPTQGTSFSPLHSRSPTPLSPEQIQLKCIYASDPGKPDANDKVGLNPGNFTGDVKDKNRQIIANEVSESKPCSYNINTTLLTSDSVDSTTYLTLNNCTSIKNVSKKCNAKGVSEDSGLFDIDSDGLKQKSHEQSCSFDNNISGETEIVKTDEKSQFQKIVFGSNNSLLEEFAKKCKTSMFDIGDSDSSFNTSLDYGSLHTELDGGKDFIITHSSCPSSVKGDNKNKNRDSGIDSGIIKCESSEASESHNQVENKNNNFSDVSICVDSDSNPDLVKELIPPCDYRLKDLLVNHSDNGFNTNSNAQAPGNEAGDKRKTVIAKTQSCSNFTCLRGQNNLSDNDIMNEKRAHDSIKRNNSFCGKPLVSILRSPRYKCIDSPEGLVRKVSWASAKDASSNQGNNANTNINNNNNNDINNNNNDDKVTDIAQFKKVLTQTKTQIMKEQIKCNRIRRRSSIEANARFYAFYGYDNDTTDDTDTGGSKKPKIRNSRTLPTQMELRSVKSMQDVESILESKKEGSIEGNEKFLVPKSAGTILCGLLSPPKQKKKRKSPNNRQNRFTIQEVSTTATEI